MPVSHREHLRWTPSRIINWAKEQGKYTGELISSLIESKPHPELGYRSAMGIISLSRRYGTSRLDNACRRALSVNACSYKSVNSILKKELDKIPLDDNSLEDKSLGMHQNIRGNEYFK